MVIVLALICMLCKVADDFIHKLVAVKEEGHHIGSFYVLQLVVIVMLLMLSGALGITKFEFESKNILLGIGVGILAFFTYYFFLKGLVSGDGSMSITIFRLNFIITGIIAFTLLGEAVTAPKIMGIALCLLSIWLMSSGNKVAGTVHTKGFIFSILACIFAGFTNVASKAAINYGAQVYSLLTFRYITALTISLFFFDLKKIGAQMLDKANMKKQIISSASSGSLMLLSVTLFYIALGIGDVTIITPIMQLSFVFTSLVCIIYFKEKITKRKVSALAVAVVCILIMTIK